jgi:hypothetical protein
VLPVASVPSSHVYVGPLAHPAALDTVSTLPDPVPADGRTVPGGCRPPRMLQPGWVTGNHQPFSVFLLHFGLEAVTRGVRGEVVHELNKPLVNTVHDLRNPHHLEPGAHDEPQDVLVAVAHTLITLTLCAAQAISSQRGGQVHVLPDPHVVKRARIERPRAASAQPVVAVHAKSVRANIDLSTVLDALVPAAAELPGTVLRLDVHDEVYQYRNYRYPAKPGAALRQYAQHSHDEVRVHPYYTEDELWDPRCRCCPTASVPMPVGCKLISISGPHPAVASTVNNASTQCSTSPRRRWTPNRYIARYTSPTAGGSTGPRRPGPAAPSVASNASGWRRHRASDEEALA